jgi:hypothetical protein
MTEMLEETFEQEYSALLDLAEIDRIYGVESPPIDLALLGEKHGLESSEVKTNARLEWLSIYGPDWIWKDGTPIPRRPPGSTDRHGDAHTAEPSATGFCR